MADTRGAERAGLLQRLEGFDKRLTAFEDRIASAHEKAAHADAGRKALSRKLEGLRGDLTAHERAHAGAIGGHQTGPPADSAGLLEWVAWLVPAYDLSEQWPLCWYRHEGLVTQLLALRRWHAALRTEHASDPAAPFAWHEALYKLSTRASRFITQTCLATHRAAAAIPVARDGELALPTQELRSVVSEVRSQ